MGKSIVENSIEVNYTKKYTRFIESVKSHIIKNKKKETSIIEITDYIYPIKKLSNKSYNIINHINLSGLNPLKGPNFISLTDLYTSKAGIVVVGLKHGVHLNDKEKKILLKVGADAYCYNLVPTSIFSASLGLKVKGIGIVKL